MAIERTKTRKSTYKETIGGDDTKQEKVRARLKEEKKTDDEAANQNEVKGREDEGRITFSQVLRLKKQQ